MIGCRKTDIVYVSFTPLPNTEGTVIVIDDRAIKVMNPKTKAVDSLRLQGYHLIHKNELQAFLEAYRR
jgi:hypothetical protein